MMLQKVLEFIGVRNDPKERASAIAKGASQKKLIDILYRKGDGTSKSYTIEPYSYRDKKLGRVLFGFDRGDKKIKMFYENNLRDVEVLDRRFKPKYPIEIPKEAHLKLIVPWNRKIKWHSTLKP